MIMKRLLMFAVVGLLFTALAMPAEAALPLYAGTSNPRDLYKYDASTRTAKSGSLGTADLDIIELEGDLYAATMSGTPDDGEGKVWRYDVVGMSWTVVASMDHQVCDLEVWEGDLYAGTAWRGGKLYRYNALTDTFDYVDTMPRKFYHTWDGIRAMYSWSKTGHLHLGDIFNDSFGRYDGTDLIHDKTEEIGSCIYDFAEFHGKLYAGAWQGRLFRSSTGIGSTWSPLSISGAGDIWEVEPFQGYLYTGDYSGKLRYLDTSDTIQLAWTIPSGAGNRQICSMVADGDAVLYIGTGGEAGYHGNDTGFARVYSYNGTSTPVEIFNADGDDTRGTDHAGIQCLYMPPFIPVPFIPVFVDIKPGSCPNPLNPKSNGVLTVAVLGTVDFDVTTIDPVSIRLSRESSADEAIPLRWAYEDVATPFEGEPCECHDQDGDGYLDLKLKFDTQELVTALDLGSEKGHTIPLIFTGNLKVDEGGTQIKGSDCVIIRQPGKKK